MESLPYLNPSLYLNLMAGLSVLLVNELPA